MDFGRANTDLHIVPIGFHLNCNLKQLLTRQAKTSLLSTKVRFFKNVLGKSVHPKIHKNSPIEINGIIGAVFVNFWMNRFSKVFS